MGKVPKPKPRKKSVTAVPNPAGLLTKIRFIAKEDTAKVIWGEHCRERMVERGITTEDALRVLRLGESPDGFTVGDNDGEWKIKIVAQLKGSRKIGVVTVVMTDGCLFVITVEWEDR